MSAPEGARGTAELLDSVGAVADSVLLEGYVLYPYRASARKNQLRWQFGVLTPRSWAEASGETWYAHTECLCEPEADTLLHVRLRFLRLRRRQVQRAEGGGFVDVDELTVRTADGENLHVPWDEGIPETVDATVELAALRAGDEREIPVELPATGTEESLTEDGEVVGRVRRDAEALRAALRVAAEEVPGPYGTLRLRLRVENRAEDAGPGGGRAADRDGALRTSLIAAHSILALSGGTFLSQTDPPEWARPAARDCRNEHTWPVLAGPAERPRIMLSSPIILPDFPEVAPESPNQLYDGLENDEILSLRTLVLTDAEKREARATDPRAAAVVDAVDGMPPEIFERLHGVIRSMKGPVPTFGEVLDEIPTYTDETGGKPWWDPGQDASVNPETDSVMIAGRAVARGSRVVLRPSGRADAQDLFLVGREATVEAVLHDVDGDTHLAVSLADDPASEFQAAHGRYRYFRPEEVQPV